MTQAVPTTEMQPNQYLVLSPTTVRLARKSSLSGVHYMDLPCTEEQLARYYGGSRELIQNVFPDCNAEQREFIQTGYTPEDWAKIFPPSKADAE